MEVLLCVSCLSSGILFLIHGQDSDNDDLAALVRSQRTIFHLQNFSYVQWSLKVKYIHSFHISTLLRFHF